MKFFVALTALIAMQVACVQKKSVVESQTSTATDTDTSVRTETVHIVCDSQGICAPVEVDPTQTK